MMFPNLDSDSKLWIFQSTLKLDSKEENVIKKELDFFLKKWTSHGNNLKATYILFKSHFIIFSVDKFFFEASGCSIDKLFQKFRDIGLSVDKNFFERNYIFFELSDQKIRSFSMSEFKKKIIEENTIKPDFIYDNSISTISALSEWKKDIEDWKEKYLPIKKGP